MKGLMVTLLILSCTGMVCAQQDYNTGRRTGDVNNSSLNNQDVPIVPIVSGEDSSSAAISGTRDASSRARAPFRETAGRAPDGSQGSSSQGGSFGASRSIEGVPSRAFGTSPNNRSLEASSRGTDTPWSNPTTVVRKNFAERETGLTQARRNESSSLSSASRGGVEDKVIYLGLPNSQLANLQRYGSVEADVKNPYVDRITISDQDRPKATPVRTIEPDLQGDKLVFRFDEQQISHLADYSFEFNVPDYMKGKYSKAVIEYPPALQRISQTNPHAGSDFAADDRRWRLAGDRSTPTLDSLEELERRRQLEEQQRKLALEREYETDRQRAEYERRQREREAAARYAEEKRLLDEHENRLARMRYEQDQLNRARQATPVSTAPPWSPYLDDRYADRRFDTSVTQPVVTQPPRDPQSDALVASMQNMMVSMDRRIAQLSSDVSRRFESDYARRADEGNTDLANTRRVHNTGAETEDPPRIRQRGLSVGRLDNDRGQTDRPQADRLAEGVARSELARKRGSWDLLMFLMLLGSVGLNLYLWAVSRGFYMRYQELADELRETFAVTST